MRNTVILVAAIVLAVGYVIHVEEQLDGLRDLILEAGEMQTSWTSGGVRRHVTTQREPGESTEAWQERHFQAVREAQQQYPPD